jgi:hypothetical protein
MSGFGKTWKSDSVHVMAARRGDPGLEEKLPEEVRKDIEKRRTEFKGPDVFRAPRLPAHFERNRYSVPASYANRPVSVRVYASRIVVAAEGQVICEHQRMINRSHDHSGQTVYDWRHYLAVLQRKPGALRNGAPFTDLPAGFKRLQAALLKQPGGDREMVEVLALVLHHEEQAVLASVELTLEAGVPTKTHVLNVLHRLLDGKPAAPPITAPQALRLVNEPQANVTRYDTLRGKAQAAHAVAHAQAYRESGHAS